MIDGSVSTSTARRVRGWLWTFPRQTLIGLVRGYRLLLKPWLGNACRFEPTCSAYTLQALQQHGAIAGTALGGWRILRCHPWCDGGMDPVPHALHGHSSRSGLLTRFTDTTSPCDAARGDSTPRDTTRTPS